MRIARSKPDADQVDHLVVEVEAEPHARVQPRNSGTSGDMYSRPNEAEVVTRRVPAISLPPRPRPPVSASRSSTSARPCSASAAPSGVACRRRVVRCSRRTPRSRSSRFRRWLATATDRSRLRAAALIEPRSSTRRNKADVADAIHGHFQPSLKLLAILPVFRRICNGLGCRSFPCMRPPLHGPRPSSPSPAGPASGRLPVAFYALTAGSFGIGAPSS